MRLLKLLLVGIVVAVAAIAGALAVAVSALSVLGIVAARRLRGHRTTAGFGHSAARRTEPVATDVIDVTATELPAELPPRLSS